MTRGAPRSTLFPYTTLFRSLCGPSSGWAQSLGAAQSFAVLGGTAVSAIGTGSVVTGDVGVSPGTAIRGFPTSATVLVTTRLNTNHTPTAEAQTAAGAVNADL